MLKRSIVLAITLSACFGSGLWSDVIPDCFTQLEAQFFQPAVLQQALSLYNVPQSAWQNITNDLQAEVGAMPDRIRRRAAAIHPNPLAPPVNRAIAKELLLSTYYEALVRVLDRYGIRSEVVRQGIFQRLREYHAELLKACVGEDVRIMK